MALTKEDILDGIAALTVIELKELLARLSEKGQFDRFRASMKIICAYFKF